MAKPIATPTRTCSTARTAVAQESVRGTECLIVAAIRQAMINASETFARAGIAAELKGGAAAKSARVRRKGQKKSPSQRAISASLRLSTTLPEDRAHRRGRALDVTDHLRGHPRTGQINYQHDGREAWDEAQRQIIDPRARLEQANDK